MNFAGSFAVAQVHRKGFHLQGPNIPTTTGPANASQSACHHHERHKHRQLPQSLALAARGGCRGGHVDDGFEAGVEEFCDEHQAHQGRGQDGVDAGQGQPERERGEQQDEHQLLTKAASSRQAVRKPCSVVDFTGRGLDDAAEAEGGGGLVSAWTSRVSGFPRSARLRRGANMRGEVDEADAHPHGDAEVQRHPDDLGLPVGPAVRDDPARGGVGKAVGQAGGAGAGAGLRPASASSTWARRR